MRAWGTPAHQVPPELPAQPGINHAAAAAPGPPPQCRFVVTQHRQAVSVQDPAQLARFLELLIGTAGEQF